MKDLILIGGGGHAKACIDVIELEKKYKIIGILDIKDRIGDQVFGYKIIGSDDDLPAWKKKCNNFHIAIGQIRSSEKRVEIFNTIQALGGNLPVIVSPNAHVSAHAKIAEGTIIMHHCVVNAGSRIGKNCIINSKALIEHDARIGDFCHISTGAIVNGGVVVGQNSFVGSGAVTKHGISIPESSFIKAGSLVK